MAEQISAEWGTYVGWNIVAILLVLVAAKWPKLARLLFSVLFLGAGVWNLFASLSMPAFYVETYGPSATLPYAAFITGPFAANPALFVVPIAVGQLAIGILAAGTERGCGWRCSAAWPSCWPSRRWVWGQPSRSASSGSWRPICCTARRSTPRCSRTSGRRGRRSSTPCSHAGAHDHTARCFHWAWPENWGPRSGGAGFQGDPVAEPLQAAHEAPLDGPAVALVEVVRTQVAVAGAVPEQVVDDHQEGVPHGDGRPALAPPGGQAAVLGREVGALTAGGGVGGLDWAVADYLATRRALGFKLERHGRLLPDLVGALARAGATTLSTGLALGWATQPAGRPDAWAQRLSVTRGFARYLQTLDPAAEVPLADLLPRRRRRTSPYLYAEAEVVALLAATATLRSPLSAATYRALLGLLAVTGMRVGEALALDRADLDRDQQRVVVRAGKFGASRALPLHPSTLAALDRYAQARDARWPRPTSPAFFLSVAGTRLYYANVYRTSGTWCGMPASGPAPRPASHTLPSRTGSPTTRLAASCPANTATGAGSRP